MTTNQRQKKLPASSTKRIYDALIALKDEITDAKVISISKYLKEHGSPYYFQLPKILIERGLVYHIPNGRKIAAYVWIGDYKITEALAESLHRECHNRNTGHFEIPVSKPAAVPHSNKVVKELTEENKRIRRQLADLAAKMEKKDSRLAVRMPLKISLQSMFYRKQK